MYDWLTKAFDLVDVTRRLFFRRRVRAALTYLYLAGGQNSLEPVISSQINTYKNLMAFAWAKGWTAEMAATVIAASSLVDLIIEEVISPSAQAAYLDYLRADLKNGNEDGLIREVQFIGEVANGGGDKNMHPFVFRMAWMNSVTANWLVRHSSIDIYAKGLFAQVIGMALQGSEFSKIKDRMVFLIDQVGTTSPPR